MDNIFDLNIIAPIIGLKKTDDRIDIFINKIFPKPIITVDKDDGANDEFIEFKKNGFGLHFMNDVLQAIHFQSGIKKLDYTKFEYPLPLGINFEQSKSEILNILGSPDVQGGGHDDFFGQVPDWFKYKKDEYSIHIEFGSDSKSIEAVTIMALD